MVRCADFYEKWKRHPNWCEKSPETVRDIGQYLDIVDELIVQGCDEGQVYIFFPEGASRPISQLEDKTLKKQAIAYVFARVSAKEKITRKEVEGYLRGDPVKSPPSGQGCPFVKKTSSTDEIHKEEARSDIPEPSVKTEPVPDEWPLDYVMKYHKTLACRESGCGVLTYVRPGLHICGIRKVRPENMLDKLPPGCPRAPAPAPKESTEAPIPSRVAVPSMSKQAERFTVEASRSDMAALRQIIARHMAEDEQEAAQTCFEEGLNLIMDRIEAKVQEEAEAAE